MKVRKPKMTKWKIYSALIALIVVFTLGFTALTTYVTYPTVEHRHVGQQLAKLDAKAFSLGEDYSKISNSKEYRGLIDSQESVYTIRMGIGSGVLSAIVSVAIIVALYRYLRRNRITSKPIMATVLIDAAASALTIIPAIYIGQAISGIQNEPITMIMLLISAPFAVGFGALITFVIAKITEWYYNRSHGFIEE